MRHTVLIVDDEPSILRAIKRTLRQDGLEVLLASSGQQALEILRQQDISVIVCDQMMPGMTGDEVLAESLRISPATYRITLTGNSCINDVQSSINQGGVQQYLLKPWNDDHLVRVVCEGINHVQLIKKNHELQRRIQEQNDELSTSNDRLETEVRERTIDLTRQNKELVATQNALSNTLDDFVGVLVGLLETRNTNLAVHSRRVSQIARSLAERLNLNETQLRNVELAGLIHEVGRIPLFLLDPESSYMKSSPGAVKNAARSATAGAALLGRVRGFEQIAQAVRFHKEHFNGSGTPDGLRRSDIPICSRLIAIADAFDRAAYPTSNPTHADHQAGYHAIQKESGKRLDPELVRIMLESRDIHLCSSVSSDSIEISVKQIKEGMELARDLHGIGGVLLLKSGSVLDAQMVARIRALDQVDQLLARIFIVLENDPEAHDTPPKKTPPQPPKTPPKTPPQTPPESPSQPPPQSSTTTTTPDQPTGKPHILIVDDDPSILSALRRNLEQIKLNVSTAQTGAKALKMIEAQKVDAVITDLHMPVLSGSMLIGAMQAGHPHIPCLVLTGHATPDIVKSLSKSPNVRGFLTKPWDPERLQQELHKALNKPDRKSA